MFNRLKAALTSRADAADRASRRPSRPLREALRPVEAVAPELYPRAVSFVHDGSGPAILLELTGHKNRQVVKALIYPGQSDHRWLNDDKVIAKLVAAGYKKSPREAIQKARNAYYASDAPLDEFARIGRLFSCLGEPPNRQVDGVPVWLVALLNDVTITADLKRDQTLSDVVPAWTPERVAELARRDGVAEGDVPALVLWALLEDHGGWGHFPQPWALPGVDDYLARVAPTLPNDTLARLCAAARSRVCQRARRDAGLAAGVAGMLGSLATDPAKTVRAEAIKALATLPMPVLAEALRPTLAKVPPSRGAELVEFLSRTDEGVALLADSVRAGGKLGALLDKAEARRTALQASAAAETVIEVPPHRPQPEVDNSAAIVAELRRALDRIIANGAKATEKWHKEAAAQARKFGDADLQELAAVAVGTSQAKPRILLAYNGWWVNEHVPSLTLTNLLRLERQAGRRGDGFTWVSQSRIRDDTDLRDVEVAISRAGLEPGSVNIANLARQSNWQPVSAEMAWPWFATRTEVLQVWLGASITDAVDAIAILECFPTLPATLLPSLATLAAGTSRQARPRAQALLAKHGVARDLAIQGLADGKGEIRAAAAEWLALIGDPSTIAPLRATLAKEKREVARAAMLTALESLGDDVSGELAPAVLLAEAASGLRAKVSSALAWLDLDHLPEATWADGSVVDPRIVRWWVVLADKLKTSDGSGLIDLYLGLLEEESAATLGLFALTSWIAHDTRHPDEEISRAKAEKAGPAAWQRAQDWLQRARTQSSWASYLPQAEIEAAKPVEQYIREAFAEDQAAYVGSAAANRGLLALTTRMPGIELTSAVQAYIRHNGSRRAQVDALMYPLFANGQPAAIQLLLGISLRFKQASVQETAKRLVQALAERRGWTSEELADRTIPAAGFGDDRLLRLDFGSREFLGRATPRGTIELTTADGKPIKALPAARADDDVELVKEAKKQLTTSRKELKSVLDLQTGRLFEAMGAGRTWAAADWSEYLAAHPLVGQLVSRLVWLENPGPAQRAFRPAEDGELLDLDDDVVTLAPGALVGLAHRVTVDRATAAAWRAHLDDYAVTPLFDQFAHDLPLVAAGATELDDLVGHLTDTFSFRNVATKRGYARGAAEDGGCFYEYTKSFGSLGLTAVLGFTGSWVPEENMTCATKTLQFRRGRRQVPLAEVPQILLAESYADYAAVAALGPFDPDWERKADL